MMMKIEGTDLNNMVSVPTRLATPISANVTEIKRTALAVARLNNTRTIKNFQKVATSGTNPTIRYTMAPNTRGGTTRKGKMSKRI